MTSLIEPGTALPATPRSLRTASIADRVIRWQKRCGRHGLPWQGTRDPYTVWVSEIMLQQTQVAAVIPYYRRFMGRFPDVVALATASQDDVLALWSGLGYYSRGRNLHRAAGEILALHGGKFPVSRTILESLPGIGRSTAAAICVFTRGAREAILDGNVKRVLARHAGIQGYPGERDIEKRLWTLADACLPHAHVEAYTQGLMDLGAAVCTRVRPSCTKCPLQLDCVALATDQVPHLPTPRPRSVLPQKHTTVLVLQYNGNVMLEKRLPNGLWGGLWCFPQIEPCEDAAEICRRRFGARALPAGELPILRHGFTHFRLDIAPRLLRVVRLDDAVRAPGIVWLTLEGALESAIPVPVRRILEQLVARR